MNDSAWGRFTEEHSELEDGDNRANFLKDNYWNKEHLLYLWHLGDTLGILDNMLNVLSKDVSVDSEGKVSVNCLLVQKKRKKTLKDEAEREERAVFRRGSMRALNELAIAAKQDNYMKLQERGEDYEIRALEETRPYYKDIYKRRMKEYKERAQEVAKEIKIIQLGFGATNEAISAISASGNHAPLGDEESDSDSLSN